MTRDADVFGTTAVAIGQELRPPAWREDATRDPAGDVCGRETCEGHDPAPAEPRLRFMRALEVIATPPPTEVVAGVVWAGGLTMLVSESGTGKTFVLSDLGAAVSDGVAWHGRATQRGSVAYFSYEGDAMGVRFSAMQAHAGRSLENLYLVRAHEPLSPLMTRDGETRSRGEHLAIESLTALRDELAHVRRPPIRLVIVDTARASMTGSEDASDSVAAYLRAVRRILAVVPDAGLIVAHHAGWQDGDTQRKRERGSSAWRGNCDATLYLEAEKSATADAVPLTLRTLKARDAERALPLDLLRRRVELDARNARGEVLTSCVIEPDRRAMSDREATARDGARGASVVADAAVLKAMRDCPAATSQRRLRKQVALRYDVVGESVARILQDGLAVAGRRGQPYQVTEKGQGWLLQNGCCS